MKNYPLTAKNWHLVAMLFGYFMLFQYLVMDSMHNTSDFNRLQFTFGILYIPVVVFSAWWSLSVGCLLNKYVNTPFKKKITKFKITVIYPMIYLNIFTFINPNSGSLFFAIFLLHLGAMYCICYNFYFISKSLAIAEKQEDVRFSEFSGYLFKLILLPIGLWVIQPKINKIHEDTYVQ